MNEASHSISPQIIESARAHVVRGDLEQAQAVFTQIVDADPANLEALNFLGTRALMLEQPARAVEFFTRAVASDESNAQSWKNLGLAQVATEQTDAARVSLERAIASAPDFFLARLHLGSLLEAQGQTHAALTNYYGAITSAQKKGRWLSPETTVPVLRELVTGAMAFVDEHRRQVFIDALASVRTLHPEADLRRVMRCLDFYLGDATPDYPDAWQRPKFLYFPDLPTSAYFARELFPWYAELERNLPIIREELDAVMRDAQGMQPFLKFNSADEVPKFLGGGAQGAPAWDAYFFYRHGERFDDNCARCPKTTAIVESLPLVRIPGHAPEICFSVLTPGTHILPHHGSTNTRLVTHLPLIVPADCALRVGGEEHVWEEGRCITFDDTFEHEAWNRSEQTRVVLILDGWNLGLRDVERIAMVDLVTAIRRFNEECGITTD